MSLFSAINSSISGLNVATMGLQVVANNVANANTPGYSTQTMDQVTSTAFKRGRFTFGTGVMVAGISQSGSRMLERQLREAIGDAESSQVQSGVYQRLEAVIGELGENDISTYLSRFFNSLQEVAQQPESQAVRGFAIGQGQALADKLNFTHAQAVDLHKQVNTEIEQSVVRVNQLLGEVASLNSRIVSAKGGSGGAGVANNLVDSRRTALRELGSLIDIRVIELNDGGVSVSTVAGSSLLINTEFNKVQASYSLNENGYTKVGFEFADGEMAVGISSGRIAGLQVARDYIADDFLGKMEDFAQHLVFEFNKMHAAGQGLSALTQTSGEHRVLNLDAPLDQAGLPFTPTNGSLKIHVRDKTTGQVKTHDVLIKLGSSPGTTLNGLKSELSSVNGIQASVDHLGRLQISTDDPNAEFYFSEDTSGVLAALGINSFFTGTRLGKLGVASSLKENPARLSTSTGGIGNDINAILGLAKLESRALPALQGRSLRGQYEMTIGDIAQKASLSKSLGDAFSQYAATLEAESLSQNGVNLDEEAAKMLQYQRAYQASARVIQTANQIFDVMMQL